MSNIKTITIDETSYSLEDATARENIEILNGSEETEGSIKNLIKTASDEIKSNFQDGVDSVYDAVVAKGSTPSSKSLSDIVAGIDNIETKITPTPFTVTVTQGLGTYLSTTESGFITFPVAALAALGYTKCDYTIGATAYVYVYIYKDNTKVNTVYSGTVDSWVRKTGTIDITTTTNIKVNANDNYHQYYNYYQAILTFS